MSSHYGSALCVITVTYRWPLPLEVLQRYLSSLDIKFKRHTELKQLKGYHFPS